MPRSPRLLPLLVALLAAGAAGPLAAATFYDHGNPTVAEQYVLELINRARLDPVAEQNRQGIPLNQGTTTTITTAPKQPLAHNKYLDAAADGHTADMHAVGFFSHTGSDGRSASQRIVDAGYGTAGGENLSVIAGPGVGVTQAYVQELHDNLYSSPGHRENIFDEGYEELGLGIDDDYSNVLGGGATDTILITENFGGWEGNGPGYYTVVGGVSYPATDRGVFLLGVCFNDANGNGFYDFGEGVAGVNISIEGNSHYTTTSSSGGYAMPMPSSGTHVLTATGNGFNHTTTVTATGQNVKRDFQPGGAALDDSPMKDFDGDGGPDLLVRSHSSYEKRIYHMTGAASTNSTVVDYIVGTLGWVVAGVGDFDKDGTADLLWRRITDGTLVIHYMDNGNKAGVDGFNFRPDTVWEVVGAADFDLNGYADILVRHSVTGLTRVHFMRGRIHLWASNTNFLVASQNLVPTLGDFNGDNRPDILWHNIQNGTCQIYHMLRNRRQTAVGAGINVNAANWEIVGSADTNRDGFDDLVLRNVHNGSALLFFMENSAKTGSASITGVPVLGNQTWKIRIP